MPKAPHVANHVGRAIGPSLCIFSFLGETRPVCSILLLARLLRIAAHNLNLLRRDVVLVVQLEVDVLDEERPDFVAEAVRIQMTLFSVEGHLPR